MSNEALNSGSFSWTSFLGKYVKSFRLKTHQTHYGDVVYIDPSKALTVSRLSASGPKVLYFLQASSDTVIPLELGDVDLYHGVVYLIMLDGRATFNRREVITPALAILDLAESLLSDNEIPSLSISGNSKALLAFSGARGEVDTTPPLVFPTSRILYPPELLLKDGKDANGFTWFLQQDFVRAFVSLGRVTPRARPRPHIHGEGGEVAFILSENGLVIDHDGREYHGGDLVISGPGTLHELTPKQTSIWLSAMVGTLTHPKSK